MEPGFVFHWLEIMIEDEEVEEIDTALLLDNIVKGEGCDDELVGCSAAPAPSSSALTTGTTIIQVCSAMARLRFENKRSQHR